MNDYQAMLRMGVVSYGEAVINRPIEAVWAVLPEYHAWSSNHVACPRKTVKGERGKVGEVVEIILQAGAGTPIYAETIRMRPLQTLDGSHQAGNMVWKVHDKDVSFSRFSDFGVREYDGKTLFYWSVYEAFSPDTERTLIIGRDQAEGKPDSIAAAVAAATAKEVEHYLAKRERPAESTPEDTPGRAIGHSHSVSAPVNTSHASKAQASASGVEAQDRSTRCREMLQTGLAVFGEVVIERPIEEVWAAVSAYYRWSPAHALGGRKTIKGEAGKAGEVVEILKAGAAEPVYAQTVRIRPPQTIYGAHKVGNIVFKVYDKDVSFSRSSDFGVREYNGKTILYRSVYLEEHPQSREFNRIRGEQLSGAQDHLPMTEMREQIEEYLRNSGALKTHAL